MKIKRIFPLVVILFALLSFMHVSVFAYGYERVYDRADLISDEDELEAVLVGFEERTGVKFRVISTHDEYFALSEIGLNSGESAIILELIKSGGTYYYEFYTYGSANAEILDSEVNRILDDPDVYDNLKSGNFTPGIKEVSKLAERAYSGNLQEPLWKTVVISLVFAFIIGGIVVVCIVIKYKRKQKAPSYPLEKYTSLILDPLGRRDEFMGSRIIKTRVNSSSGSSGRRSGGGSRGRR